MDPALRQPRQGGPRSSSPTPDRSDPDEQEKRDENLDRTIEETFPASDPPSTIPDPADGDEPRRRPDDNRLP